MRIAVVALGTPTLRSSWSGIPYYALTELARRFTDLHVIDTPALDRQLKKLNRLVRFGFAPLREPLVTALFERVVNERVAAIAPDLVISIGAAHKVARLDRGVPLIHVADGLFSTIVDYYPKYAGIGRRSRRIGEAVQRQVVERARFIALTSDWAAHAATEDFPDAAARIRVVPMGANLDHDPPPAAPRCNVGPLKLLFVGYDWKRKGGELILPVFQALRARYTSTELHIVGARPAATLGLPGVVHHGALDKSDPAQRAQLDMLFRDSHLFFMPSRQEAFGLVYCEACAFGLPSIASHTGGVPTIVQDDHNGRLLPSDSTVADYLTAITELWSDGHRYRQMQEAARTDYEVRLNWRSWGAGIEALATDVGR